MARPLAHADVFAAIADPTRRVIMDLLREGERSAGELFRLAESAVRRMSQPAFSQHLAVLRRAGLVISVRRTNFCYYRLDARPLATVFDWVGHYDKFWDQRLDALDEYIQRQPRGSKSTREKRTERTS